MSNQSEESTETAKAQEEVRHEQRDSKEESSELKDLILGESSQELHLNMSEIPHQEFSSLTGIDASTDKAQTSLGSLQPNNAQATASTATNAEIDQR